MSIKSVVNDTASSESIINATKPLPPTIVGYSVSGSDDTALDPAGGQTVQINGTGFLRGATITFDGSAVAVVTYVNATQLTFTSPAKSAGTYTIYVVNPDGGTAIYIPGIIYSLLPTWTTGAGTLGSYYETTNISNTVVASGDAPITYSLYSGSLPTGSTLAANGVITGSAPVDSSSTTYSFTIEAIDAQLQSSTRSFSLTINTDVVTWSTPANGTTYTSAVDSAIANVTLSASSAAGYGIVYTANALPTGISLSGNTISGTPTVIADSSTLLTATANTTNRTSTRTINWSITVANDPYFEYNTLLIPGASTTFVDDASTNNFAVSIFGDTKPNSFNPYTPSYYSNFFQAGAGYSSGNGLSVAANSAFAFGTGDYTVEFWTRPTAFGDGNSTAPTMVSVHNGGTDSGWQLYWNSLALGIRTYYSNVVYWNADMTPYLNKWSHIAYVRYNGTQKIYVDGVEKCSTAATWNWTDTALSIGFKEQYYTGNISNLRIVKGTAVYTGNFTPPTSPLTAISGTSLLTCQSNRFIDNSSNNFAITLVNSPTVSSANPFTPNSSYSTYGSGYFDGTGDSLRLANNTALGMGTGDFTIEFWLYQTAISDYRQILDIADGNSTGRLILWVDGGGTLYNLGQNGGARNSTAGGAIKINTWTHVVLTRASGTTRFYINGTQSGSNYTDSTNYTCTTGTMFIGTNEDGSTYAYQGYLTDFRMVKGTAVYTSSFTPPSAPLTAISGTSLLILQNNQSVNNSTFLDTSTNNLPVTYVGTAAQGTFSPYGGNWSNYFDGSGDYLSLPSASTTYLSNNAFTIETWVYPTATTASQIISRRAVVTARGFFLTYSDIVSKKFSFYAGDTNNASWEVTLTSTNTFEPNQWIHVAVTRNASNVFTLWVNGVSQATSTVSFTIGDDSSTLYIGTIDGGSSPFNGYISNLRLVQNTALYTTSFTPSTTPLIPIANTGLLTCQSNRLVDTSSTSATITKAGDVSVQRFSPFNPSIVTPTSYSGYFDGSGDYVTVAGSTGLDFSTGDFTIEAWINRTAYTSGRQNPIIGRSDSGFTFSVFQNQADTGTTNQGKIGITVSDTVIAFGTTVTQANTWYHVAVSRSGSTLRIFVNGSLENSTTYSTAVSLASSYIGWNGYDYSWDTRYFNGYISNLRIIKGTAIYTSSFTPATSPLTAISGTQLLACQSTTFIDNSTNNYTLTGANQSKPVVQNPFGYTSTTTNGYTPSTIGGSNYSDATGTIYSNVASPIAGTTTNWTMECWTYFNAITVNTWIMGLGNNTGGTTPYLEMRIGSSGTTIILSESSTSSAIWTISASFTFTPRQWYHLAGTRSGTTLRLFVNGIQVATGTHASAIQSGLKPFTQGLLFSSGGSRSDGVNGYVSDTRMLCGTALYTSNFVPPTTPLQAINNTCWLVNGTGASIYDAAMMADVITLSGAGLRTSLTKFGGSSMYFDGTDDHIQAYNVQALGNGDFTFEMWIYPLDTASRHVMSFGAGWSPTNGISMIQYGGNFALSCGTGWAPANAGQAIEINGWHHIALVRNNTAVKFYYDGVLKGSGTDSTNLTATAIDIGYVISSGGWGSFYGYIDDVRITKGYARYTSNFTPPTSAFQTY